MFPKNHVVVKPSLVKGAIGFETIESKEDPVAREVAEVVQEWGTLLLQLFSDRNERGFHKLKEVMMELIKHRKQILSRTLPSDHLKELKSRVAAKIDWGNRELGLDVIPRNGVGEKMDPKVSSVMDLFKVHLKVQSQSKLARKLSTQSIRSLALSGASQQSVAYQLFLKHKTYNCYAGEDVEIRYMIYDGTPSAKKFINEPFIVKLTKGGAPASNQGLSCIYTGLDPDCLDNLYIVALVSRTGTMDIVKDKKTDEKKKAAEQAANLRRPIGCGCAAVRKIRHDTADGNTKECPVTLFKCDDDVFYQLHEYVIMDQQARFQPVDKGKGLAFECTVLRGAVAQVKRDNPLLFQMTTVQSLKRGFPDIMVPGEERNDLYVTIKSGEFEKTTLKTTHRNIRVRMTVCLENGETLENCIYVSPNQPPCTAYESMIYYHTNAPKWNETVKLDIPHTSYTQAHLRFEVYHCSSNPGKKSQIFCFAYKRLSESGPLKDGKHTLPVYKYDHKFHSSKNDGKVPYIARPNQVPPSSRDHFLIETNSCLTRRSQDTRLLNLLERKWKPQGGHPPQTTLLETLMKLTEVPGTEIVKFLPRVFNCVFDSLDDLRAQSKNDDPAFTALMHVLGLVSFPQFRNFKSEVDKYIQRMFSNRRAHEFLSKALVDCNTKILNRPTAFMLQMAHKTMKSLEYVFKLMVKSREIRNRYSAIANQDDGEFKAQIHAIFKSFSTLMESKDPGVGQIQESCLASFATVFDDLLLFFTAEELSKLAKDFLTTVQKSGKNQLMFVKYLAQSTLFRDDGGRKQLLETVLEIAAKYFSESDSDMGLTLDIVGNILGSLQCSNSRNVKEDVIKVAQSLLEPLLRLSESIDANDDTTGMQLSCLLAVLRLIEVYVLSMRVCE